MPQCKKCEKYLPPQFLVQMLTMPDDQEALQCIYCDQNINEITIKKDTGIVKYTKKQCIKDYEIFIKKLKENKKISDILANESSQGLIIKP